MAYRIKCLLGAFVFYVILSISPNYRNSQIGYINKIKVNGMNGELARAYFDLGLELFLTGIFALIFIILVVQVIKPARRD